MEHRQAASRGRNRNLSLSAPPSSFTVVDVETTGLSPTGDEIIEIAAVRYSGWERGESFATLVKPKRAVSSRITKLTGIENGMLEGAPPVEDVIVGLREFVGDSVIVGYNVKFDLNFLNDDLVRCTGSALRNDYVDVLAIARRKLPQLAHHSQTDVAAYYSIPTEGAHRAEFDCELCAMCYERLVGR